MHRYPFPILSLRKARHWIEAMLSDPFSSSSGLSDDRLVQRFALATSFGSTALANGTYWDHRGGWLDSKNESDWDSNAILGPQESAVAHLLDKL